MESKVEHSARDGIKLATNRDVYLSSLQGYWGTTREDELAWWYSYRPAYLDTYASCRYITHGASSIYFNYGESTYSGQDDPALVGYPQLSRMDETTARVSTKDLEELLSEGEFLVRSWIMKALTLDRERTEHFLVRILAEIGISVAGEDDPYMDRAHVPPIEEFDVELDISEVSDGVPGTYWTSGDE